MCNINLDVDQYIQSKQYFKQYETEEWRQLKHYLINHIVITSYILPPSLTHLHHGPVLYKDLTTHVHCWPPPP